MGEARDRAGLAGDNGNAPELLYLGPTAKVKVGDYVTTSGHGRVFPPGLPIGVVSAVGERGIRVQPFVDWAHMEVLRIVEYALTGILDFEAEVGAARAAAAAAAEAGQGGRKRGIGSASCRERGGLSVSRSVVGGSLKKKKTNYT